MTMHSFLPSTRRQWAGLLLFVCAVCFAVWQSVYFGYRQQLRQEIEAVQKEIEAIQKRELLFWTSTSTNSPSAIVAVDCETGRIVGWNPAATRILGWTPDDVVGEEYLFLIPREYLESKYSNAERYLDTVTDPIVYRRQLNEVKVVDNAFVNTKAGERPQCRVSIRTIGGARYFYVVTIDPLAQVEVVEPMVEP